MRLTKSSLPDHAQCGHCPKLDFVNYWWVYLRKPGLEEAVLQGAILDREIEGFALDMSFSLHATDLYLTKFKWLGARRLNAIIISPTKTLEVL